MRFYHTLTQFLICFSIRIQFYFVYDVQWPEDQCLIFVNDDQGHDHFPHDARGDVGHGHVGVNGFVKDEGRGEMISGF